MSANLLISYYGDDFTGSTDVMESLTMNGVPTVLFLEPPTADHLARFPDMRAIGIAGISRSKSPEWMDAHLPAIFEALRALDAPISHYKVCSTFDSSPRIGSIGRAIDIGMGVFGVKTVPVVVGAPALRRYQVFGNLFATVDKTTHRIDRHPTMSVHPATPMREGDLRRHLSLQTERTVGLVDILALGSDDFRDRARSQAGASEIVFHDVLDDRSLSRVGDLIWDAGRGKLRFCAGSSGIEYALVAHWRDCGLIGPADLPAQRPKATDRVFVMSGSCSPVTAGQIEDALDAGFLGLNIDPAVVLDADTRADAVEAAISACVDTLDTGRSVVAYSTIGAPGQAARALSMRDPEGFSRDLSAAQALIFRETLLRTGTTRAIVAGGDTSGGVAGALGLYALTALAPAAPGAPLCRAHSDEPAFDGLEIVLKGGQMGARSMFRNVRDAVIG